MSLTQPVQLPLATNEHTTGKTGAMPLSRLERLDHILFPSDVLEFGWIITKKDCIPRPDLVASFFMVRLKRQ